MPDNDKLESLERRLEELRGQFEELGRRIGDGIEERVGGINLNFGRSDRSRTIFGLVLLVVGIIWLGNRLGWFFIDIPFWPVVLILVGLLFIFNRRN